jgi:hypothetical protein
MSEATPRFQLPFVIPGQAQKELFHNEALLRVDAAMHAAVKSSTQTAPPEAPAEGECWVIAAPATGSWSGKEGQIAMWSSGGWRFVLPRPGLVVWNEAEGVEIRWLGAAWSAGELRCTAIHVGGEKVLGERGPAVPSPSGGTVIDAEARAALDAVIATLMSHGLIE